MFKNFLQNAPHSVTRAAFRSAGVFTLLLAICLYTPTIGATSTHHLGTALKGETYTQKLQTIEAYLNTLTTFSAQFEQAVNGIQPSSGAFYLQKPGKFLWHYQKPDPSKLVSNGGVIYFHDETTNQTTQVPRQGMADLLTRSTFTLEKEKAFKVTSLRQQKGLLHLELSFNDLKEGDVGKTLILTFLQNPTQLRQITTFNQLGQRVEMLFYNIHEGTPIAPKTFKFTPFHYREK